MPGREGSVAPKERINIRYKTDNNGVKEERELPLKLLVVADFTMRADPETSIEERTTTRITPNKFNDVLREQNIELKFNVDDVVSETKGQELGVHLKFDSIKSFSPTEIAMQVPELRKLLELRNELKEIKGHVSNKRQFRDRLAAILADEKAVAEILRQVEGGGTPEAEPVPTDVSAP